MRYSEARSTGQRRRAGSGEGGGGADPIGSFYNTETHIATTSGTAHDFTGLPAGLNEMFAVLDGVIRTDGDDDDIIQLGDSGGAEATGYESAALRSDATSYTLRSDTTGVTGHRASSTQVTGVWHFVRLDGEEWVADVLHAGRASFENAVQGGGDKALSAELDRVRLTRGASGTGTYSAGFIGLLHAGA